MDWVLVSVILTRMAGQISILPMISALMMPCTLIIETGHLPKACKNMFNIPPGSQWDATLLITIMIHIPIS